MLEKIGKLKKYQSPHKKEVNLMKKVLSACLISFLLIFLVCIGTYKYSKTKVYVFTGNDMMYAKYHGKIYYEEGSITPEIFTNHELFQDSHFQIPTRYYHKNFCDNSKIYAVETIKESKRFGVRNYLFAKPIHTCADDSDCFYIENNQVFGPPSWIFYCEDFQLPSLETTDVEAIRLDYLDTSILITQSDKLKSFVERIRNKEDFVDLIESSVEIPDDRIKVSIVYANSSLNEFIGIIENGILQYEYNTGDDSMCD